MEQMNISITPRLAGYVRAQVRHGRYNNASEVVRDAIRRMEEADARSLRVANPTAEDVITDLTQADVDSIRRRVLEGFADLKAGSYTVYEGREGLKRLVDQVKTEGRRSLRERSKG